MLRETLSRESLAEPGTTHVTGDTFRLTEGFLRFEALGEKAIKGTEAPVRGFQVIAPSTRRTRFDVTAERGLTFFVGRERELLWNFRECPPESGIVDFLPWEFYAAGLKFRVNSRNWGWEWMAELMWLKNTQIDRLLSSGFRALPTSSIRLMFKI